MCQQLQKLLHLATNKNTGAHVTTAIVGVTTSHGQLQSSLSVIAVTQNDGPNKVDPGNQRKRGQTNYYSEEAEVTPLDYRRYFTAVVEALPL